MSVDRKRLRELALAAAPGPYFVGSDDAEECGPHANSGLSLVDTGRREDWPIARLCESASAAWIAATDPQTILALLDALEAAEQPTDDALNAAINRAARDLPGGLVVAVHAERGSGWITLESTAGERFPTPDSHHDSLAAELNAVIDYAIAEQAKGRT